MTSAINNENGSSRQIPSLESCQSTIHKIAGVKGFKYKMCVNHCIAFTGNLSVQDVSYVGQNATTQKTRSFPYHHQLN